MSSADDAYRADALLKSMETNFLSILAEHETSVPKAVDQDEHDASGSAAAEAAVSLGPGTSTDGEDVEDDTVCLHWHVTEAWLDHKVDAMIRWGVRGDMDAMRELMGVVDTALKTLILRGTERGWHGIVEDEEDED